MLFAALQANGPVHTLLAVVLCLFSYLCVEDGDIPCTALSAKSVVSSNSFSLAVLCTVDKKENKLLSVTWRACLMIALSHNLGCRWATTDLTALIVPFFCFFDSSESHHTRSTADTAGTIRLFGILITVDWKESVAVSTASASARITWAAVSDAPLLCLLWFQVALLSPVSGRAGHLLCGGHSPGSCDSPTDSLAISLCFLLNHRLTVLCIKVIQ